MARGPATARAKLASPELLVDFGSTFTKLRAVDPESGALVGTAQCRTTIGSDLMDGFVEAVAELRVGGLDIRVDGPALGCSSAAGGLRVAVVGLERDLTAQAAKQVALNSGGRIVALTTAAERDRLIATVAASAADLVLLVGGIDGGNRSFAADAARALATAQLGVPVIFAGNQAAAAEVTGWLNRGQVSWRVAPNVLPEIGRVEVDAVQAVIRAAFIEHVIKGNRLSVSSRFGQIVALPTPDAVLEAVKLLATDSDGEPGEILVVDVGGATTDVYSCLSVQNTASSRSGSLVPAPPAARTVEADLGLRWSAESLLTAARDLGLVEGADDERLVRAAQLRASDPGFVPRPGNDSVDDLDLARLAVIVAVSRHAGRDRVVLTPAGADFRRMGRDIRQIRKILLTGGVFQAHAARNWKTFLDGAFDGFDQRRELVPSRVHVAVDSEYVLAAAGLLSTQSSELARRLIRTTVRRSGRRTHD